MGVVGCGFYRLHPAHLVRHRIRNDVLELIRCGDRLWTVTAHLRRDQNEVDIVRIVAVTIDRRRGMPLCLELAEVGLIGLNCRNVGRK